MKIAVNTRLAFLERPILERLLARSSLFSPSPSPSLSLPFPAQCPVNLSATWHRGLSKSIHGIITFFLRRVMQLGIYVPSSCRLYNFSDVYQPRLNTGLSSSKRLPVSGLRKLRPMIHTMIQKP